MISSSARPIGLFLGMFVFLAVLLLAVPALAAHGTQTCTVPGGYATIQAAVNNPACELVSVGSGTFDENVVIGRSVTIAGQGVSKTIVDGRGGDVFHIQATNDLTRTITTTVTISRLSLVNGGAGLVSEAGTANGDDGTGTAVLLVDIKECAIRDNAGSGLLNRPTYWGQTAVTISGSTVSGNLGWGLTSTPDLLSEAKLRVIDSTVSDNLGGGIANLGCIKHLCFAALHVSGSTISGNRGSGIDNSADAEVINSTISGNTARWGGGIFSCGSTTLANSTISGNLAEIGGGILIIVDDAPYGCYGFVAASHNIVANSESGGDCVVEGKEWKPFGDDGYNIVEDGSCIDAATSRAGDPLLGPLADNGGRTLTHALLPGSPAIDAGAKGSCPATDQRDYSRPADGDLDGMADCDIGSFELRYLPYSYYMDLIMAGA